MTAASTPVRPHRAGAPTGRPHAAAPPAPARGLAVYLGVPAGRGAPSAVALVEAAELLRELAHDAVPGATAHVEVRLAGYDEPAPDGITIDLGRRQVTAGGDEPVLTRREFDLLAHLATAERVVSREELMATVWRTDGEPAGDRTIDVHVRRLRGKLGRHGLAIGTVRGLGYRLDSPVTLVGVPARRRPR